MARECGEDVVAAAAIRRGAYHLLVTVECPLVSRNFAYFVTCRYDGPMERLVFVHGSVTGGRRDLERAAAAPGPFRARCSSSAPASRPNPPVDRVDFEDARRARRRAISGGDHLVGHSYGGVVALLAAASACRCRSRSLTVIEPPATAIARGDRGRGCFTREGIDWWETGPTDDPEAFLRGFLAYVGSEYDPPSPLPPELEQGARTLIVERGPWEAEVPLEALAAAPFPDARRLGRASRRLRCHLRRARATPRRGAARPAPASATRPSGTRSSTTAWRGSSRRQL